MLSCRRVGASRVRVINDDHLSDAAAAAVLVDFRGGGERSYGWWPINGWLVANAMVGWS